MCKGLLQSYFMRINWVTLLIVNNYSYRRLVFNCHLKMKVCFYIFYNKKNYENNFFHQRLATKVKELKLLTSQVLVQTEIGLWSDPVERTEITGSGRKFERTSVWTMVWRWSDQRSIWSEKSDHRRIRAHLGLIRGEFKRNWIDHNLFERTFVWSEATSSAIGLIITSSSALGSDQKCFRTQLGVIRDHFERIILFHFFVFLLLRDVGSAKRQP